MRKKRRMVKGGGYMHERGRRSGRWCSVMMRIERVERVTSRG